MFNDDKKGKAFGFWDSGLGGLFKGVIISLIVTLILLTVSSLIITYTGVSENMVPVFAMASAVISILVGSIASSKTAKSKGYLIGALCGLVYILMLYIVASLISERIDFNGHTATLFVVGAVVGAVGGVIGINTGGKKKR